MVGAQAGWKKKWFVHVDSCPAQFRVRFVAPKSHLLPVVGVDLSRASRNLPANQKQNTGIRVLDAMNLVSLVTSIVSQALDTQVSR